MFILDKEITIEAKFIKRERVKISECPSAGYEVILEEQKGRIIFGIRLENLNYTIFVDINMNQLEKA